VRTRGCDAPFSFAESRSRSKVRQSQASGSVAPVGVNVPASIVFAKVKESVDDCLGGDFGVAVLGAGRGCE
jgi:hypothetical protein